MQNTVDNNNNNIITVVTYVAGALVIIIRYSLTLVPRRVHGEFKCRLIVGTPAGIVYTDTAR